MSSKIQKWGNSLALRIPKSIITKIGLEKDSEVQIDSKDGLIIVTPRKMTYSLEKMLAQITKENLHREQTDSPEGNEIW